MKRIRKLLFGTAASLVITASAQLVQFNQGVTLAFDYPTNYWALVNATAQTTITNQIGLAALTNCVVKYYGTTNLLGTNTQWTLLLSVANPQAVTNGGVASYVVTVPTLGGQTFYTAQFSNLLATSFFSGLAATPPLPPNPSNFQIRSAQ